MKYIYITTLMILSLFLTSCFQKPAEEIVPVTNIDTQETETSLDSLLPEDTQSQDKEETSTGSENETNSGEEESSEEEERNEDLRSEEEATQTGAQDEQEIIEGYEEDLEELFNDILGS